MIDKTKMFTRKDSTYFYSDELLSNILKDEASPLNRVINEVSEGSKILDVGAGGGLLGKLFQFANKKIVIDGIEPSSYAASLISHEYRNFYNGYIQDYQEQIIKENYNYIIFADVIEHIDNPIEVFEEFFNKLDINTKIIISVPNIAFATTRLSLFYGKFEYVDSGILEATHLRFYTKETLNKLIEAFHFNIEKFYYLQRNFYRTEINIHNLQASPFAIKSVSKDELSHVYQFFYVLTKNECTLVHKKYGSKSKFPIIEYILKPLIQKNDFLKKLAKKVYK